MAEIPSWSTVGRLMTASCPLALAGGFSNPDLFDEPDQIAASGEQYRVLKEETDSLWEEWARLSLEAETIDSKLTGLKTG